MSALAVLDYGIGGLDVWRALRDLDPERSLIYLSDAGYTPYGQLTANALARRLEALAVGLKRKGASALVIACNAASSALPPTGDATLCLPTLGIIDAGVSTVLSSNHQHIGVIGGGRTIHSYVYQTPLERAGLEVSARVAQPLSICVEAGDLSSPELRRHLDEILAPLASCDALLLACTHYPALAPLIEARLPGVALLDPARELVRRARERWPCPHLTSPALRSHTRRDQVYEVYTTGDPQKMSQAARAAFGVELNRIERWTYPGVSGGLNRA